MIRDIILLLYGALLLLLAVRSLRAQRLKERYVLLLLFTGLPFLGLAIWPDALARLAALAKVPYHTMMIMLLVFYFILIIVELMSIISVLERRMSSLAQHMGILMEKQRSADELSATNSQPPAT